MTCVILTGGIDLSVRLGDGAFRHARRRTDGGRHERDCRVVGWALRWVSARRGQRFFVAFAGMPPIIVTLATMGIARSLRSIYTGGYPIDGLPESGEASSAAARFSAFKAPVVIMAVIVVIAWVLLERMAPFGRYVYAIGGNEQATRLSGVRVARVKLIVYTIAGLTSSFAAIVLTARLMSGQPNGGVGFELDAIPAVGDGRQRLIFRRTRFDYRHVDRRAAALLCLNNGLNMVGVNPCVQNVIEGGIILLAIFIAVTAESNAFFSIDFHFRQDHGNDE